MFCWNKVLSDTLLVFIPLSHSLKSKDASEPSEHGFAHENHEAKLPNFLCEYLLEI